MRDVIRKILREVYNSTPDEDVVGKEFWFEYHCWESPKSCDAELWYRSHQKVLVLRRGIDDNDEYSEEPKVFDVVFKDGFEGTVYADELMYSPNEFYRPDPPNRVIREQLNPIKWVKPDYEDEEEEFALAVSNLPGLVPEEEEIHGVYISLELAFMRGPVEVLSDKEWSQMENTDSWELETEEDIYNIVGGYGRSEERILKHSLEPIRNGGVVETPIVLYWGNKPPYLVAGNTRLSACKVLGVRPMVTKVYL